MSQWPSEGNPGDFPVSVAFHGHVSPSCGPPYPGVGGLSAASEQCKAVEKVGGGTHTGPSAGCCRICDWSDFPLHRISTLIYFMKA